MADLNFPDIRTPVPVRKKNQPKIIAPCYNYEFLGRLAKSTYLSGKKGKQGQGGENDRYIYIDNSLTIKDSAKISIE